VSSPHPCSAAARPRPRQCCRRRTASRIIGTGTVPSSIPAVTDAECISVRPRHLRPGRWNPLFAPLLRGILEMHQHPGRLLRPEPQHLHQRDVILAPRPVGPHLIRLHEADSAALLNSSLHRVGIGVGEADDHGASLGRNAQKPVTQIVTTTPDPGRPDATASDCRSALTCGNQTPADCLRRNRGAWHAEGQGGSNPLSSTGFETLFDE
jgi:hypothetical protein